MSGDPNSPSGAKTPAPQPPRASLAATFAAGLPARGDLREQGALHLHFLLAATQASGRLVLELPASGPGPGPGPGPGAGWRLVYRRGVVEHAAGSHEEDDLAAFLVRHGLLAPDAAADARLLAPALGGDVLGALVELRLLDPSARFQELKEHGAGLLRRALGAEGGTWAWEPGVAPPPFAFPLGSRFGPLVDAVRRLEPSAVRARLGSRAGLALARAGGRVELGELLLNPQEARAASRIDGARSLDELCAASPAESDVLRRVVLLLAEADLVSFGAARPAPSARPQSPTVNTATPPPRPVAGPSSPAAPAAPAAPASPAKAPTPARSPTPARASAPAKTPAPAGGAPAPGPTLESLRTTAKSLKEADHFQALGVGRDADRARIKAAYFQRARTYHPDATREGDPPEARALRSEIFARVAAAWAVLETDAGRQAYLEELAAGGAVQVDIARIYEAEQAFEKVAVLVATRAYADALARVNEAIALYADEPEYHVWKAWIEFLLAPEAQRKGQRAASEKAIEGALLKSPMCVPAWLFLGRIAKISGDAAAAERAWKRGLEKVPDPDLERELRFLKR